MTPNELMCTIVSFVPIDIREEKPGLTPGYFMIPASDLQRPSILHVGTARHYVYLDQDRGSLPARTPSDELARSIVQDYITAQMEIGPNAQPALFWVVGRRSAQDVMKDHAVEVKEAIEKQRRWFIACCRLADDDWNKYHKHNAISDNQRKFAQLLGYKPDQHPWMSREFIAEQATCPACGSGLAPNAIICQTCRCIVDKERYAQLEFAKGT